MANNSITLSSLDFNTLKQEFKSYLSSQSAFKDYNFDSSNMNVLIDVMTYNSYLNSFYLNMVASEMFLDSAQKLDSVVSHAKEMNYVPQSAKSSTSIISFDVTTSGVNGVLAIPKGTTFSGTNANGVYTFITDKLHNYTSPNSVYSITDLTVYEGTYNTDVFVMDYSVESQKFVLTNQLIDTSSITVTVNESGSNTVYSVAETLFGLDQNSEVYFLQAAQNGLYEIVFGDGLFGKQPDNLAVIYVEYRVCHGTKADGITNLICTRDIGVDNNGSAVLSNITVNQTSTGSAEPQSIESIRFSAPRYFATQQRAVTTDDFSSLVLNNFGGQFDDVTVYGGETLDPKQYGRVVVALKPAGGTIAPQYLKDDVSSFLKNYTSLPTRVIVADPEYYYVGINTRVQYNKQATTKLSSEIKSIIRDTISTFNTDNLSKFGNDFRYSKFVASIDNADASITSNDTDVYIVKRISPTLNYATSYTIPFNNQAETEVESPGYTKLNALSDEPMITSSAFTYVDASNVEWPNCYFRDDNIGVILIYTVIQGKFTILNRNAGTINYATGLVTLKAFKTSYYDQYIAVKFVPAAKDIIVNDNSILLIDVNSTDVTVEVIETIK